ncbi:rRNA pseudouridine synthase [Martelella alba]|uniref:Pseudouridine synthase n=1 Tax=Martelella alba TaxID=2590451 RepID=A0A506U7Y4_9HYPH|nr:pseudouridine synthase [Martelella alba]TPW30532.1 rRNA pseudouridine synthase [Martelella alba]
MSEKDKFKRFGGKPAQGKGRPGPKKPAGSAAKPAAAAAQSDAAGQPERISKILARAGVASRRDAERMILEGRVRVNGTVLESPALNATLADRIEVDGEPIRGIERTRLWIYHKPAGLVTTNADPEGRPTVFDNLPKDLPRVISIGRLDINTEGLLLLTNDGGLARVLELPSTGWLRRYRVRAHGSIDQAGLDKLKEGIAVDGVLYGAIDATLDRTQGSNVWITMGLREGKNREIKNVLGALGLSVNRLIRISYGPFQLGDIAEGNVLEVRGRTLRDQLGPRLIEDAGANFDAPLYSDRPDKNEEEPARPAQTASRPERAERPRRDKPADKRERGRDRLDTKPAEQADIQRGRVTNVWMAPGARPLGPKAKKKAEDKARQDARRDERRAAGRRGDGRRSAEGDATEKPFRPRGEKKPFDGEKRGGKSFAARGEGRPERKGGDKPFARGDRKEGGRPSGGSKPFGKGPRPQGGRPSGGGKPRGGAKGAPGKGRS